MSEKNEQDYSQSEFLIREISTGISCNNVSSDHDSISQNHVTEISETGGPGKSSIDEASHI